MKRTASLLVVACAVLCADITTAAEPDRAAVKTVTQTVEALIDDLSTDVNADEDSSAHGACPAGFSPYSYNIRHTTYTAHGGLGNSSLTLNGCANLCTSSSSCGAFEFNAAPGKVYQPCYMQAAPTAGMRTAQVAGWLSCVKTAPKPRAPAPARLVAHKLRAAEARKKAAGKKKAAGEWANVMKWFVHHHTKPQCSPDDKGCICMASDNPKYAAFCCRAGIKLAKFTWEFFLWGIRTGRSHQMLTNGWFTKRGLVLYIHEVLAVYKCYSKKQTIYNLKHAGRQIKDGLKSILKILHPFGDMDSNVQAATQEIDDQGVSAEDLSIKKTAADAGRADAHPLQSLLQYSGAGGNCGAWEME